jgi:hypothetical protein
MGSQVLPGSKSRRCPVAHRRGQLLHSEAPNAKNAPESAICGVLRKRLTTTGSVLVRVWFSIPRPTSFPSALYSEPDLCPLSPGICLLPSVLRSSPRRSRAKAGQHFSVTAFPPSSFRGRRGEGKSDPLRQTDSAARGRNPNGRPEGGKVKNQGERPEVAGAGPGLDFEVGGCLPFAAPCGLNLADMLISSSTLQRVPPRLLWFGKAPFDFCV